MSGSALSALRDELDRLRVEAPGPPTLWDRLRGDHDAPPDTPELLALDEELARAGVHTLADARLLGRLARKDKRARELASGMQRRVRKAQGELEALLAGLGRTKRKTGKVAASQLLRAEDRLTRLERALALERGLSAPEKHEPRDAAPVFRPRPARSPPQGAALAAIERYLERAQSQALDLRRKRRDLDRAHELLLSLAAALKPQDHARAQELRAKLADERHRLAAVEEVVAPGESLPSAVQRALGEGNAQAAYRGLLAVYRGALEGRNAALAEASRAALGELFSASSEAPEAALAEDARRTLTERLGQGALRDVLDAHLAEERDPLVETAFDLQGERFSLFNLALSSGEFFDTSATEEEVDEGDPAMARAPEPLRRVPFPTPTMDFDVARGIHELRDFVIRDPRLVLYDVANGTQLVRAYYERQEQKPRKTRRSAVRVYVCDASGSMRGARARFRDAILIAELNNLSLRARAKKEIWPIYYAFFNDQPTPLQRVDTPRRAYQLIADLFESSPARGRTDITYALVSAFEAIHEARGRDPDLARATVVLITDGEDQVDLARIGAARAPVGDVEITLNFISLGEENPDLRALITQQRDRGRRAFYTHLSDEDIASGASPFEPNLRTLLPDHPELELTPDSPAIKAALDALAAIAVGQKPPEGPPPSSRFGAYFPGQLPEGAGHAEVADRDRVQDLLAAVCEALALAPSGERADEAVELLEHLLSLYAVPLERYRAALASGDAELVKLLSRVRLLSGQAPLQEPAEAARSA